MSDPSKSDIVNALNGASIADLDPKLLFTAGAMGLYGAGNVLRSIYRSWSLDGEPINAGNELSNSIKPAQEDANACETDNCRECAGKGES